MRLLAVSSKDRPMSKLAAPGSGLRTLRRVFFCTTLIAAVALSTGCGDNGASAASDPGGGGGGKGGKGGRRGAGGDVPVTVATAIHKDVPVEVQVIGNVEAYSTITVKAQIGGELNSVHFREGDFVKKGDVLFEIDRRPLEASLNQAVANTARDRAALGQAEANLAKDQAQAKYSETQAKRYAELAQSGVISAINPSSSAPMPTPSPRRWSPTRPRSRAPRPPSARGRRPSSKCACSSVTPPSARPSTDAPATSPSSRAMWSPPTTWT